MDGAFLIFLLRTHGDIFEHSVCQSAECDETILNK